MPQSLGILYAAKHALLER